MSADPESTRVSRKDAMWCLTEARFSSGTGAAVRLPEWNQIVNDGEDLAPRSVWLIAETEHAWSAVSNW